MASARDRQGLRQAAEIGEAGREAVHVNPVPAPGVQVGHLGRRPPDPVRDRLDILREGFALPSPVRREGQLELFPVRAVRDTAASPAMPARAKAAGR